MANIGFVRSFLGGLPEDQRRSFVSLFEYLIPNLRIGLPGHLKRAENMQWIQVNSTTHATANTELPIRHGLGVAPHVAFPALDLTTANNSLPVITTTRPADANYVYVKSASTGVPFVLFVEAR